MNVSGILQKGDGANIYLKHKPRLIITAMGDGRQRELECGTECYGKLQAELRIYTRQKIIQDSLAPH